MSRHRRQPAAGHPPDASGGDPLPHTPHERAIGRVRRALMERGAPRLQMSFIVVATGTSGLAASILLREFGVRHMGLRYGLAVACSYGAFLALLGTWLHWQRARAHAGKRSIFSRIRSLDVSLDLGGGSGRASGGGGWGRIVRGGGVRRWSGGGGDSGGAGASAFVDMPPTTPSLDPSALGPPPPAGSGVEGGIGNKISDAASHALDTDEVVAIVVTVAAVLSALVAAVYVVYAAPMLLADVLVDGAVSAGLYRRLRRAEGHTWWQGAIQRTAVPAAVVLVTFVAAGFVIHRAWPDAVTLLDAWYALRTR